MSSGLTSASSRYRAALASSAAAIWPSQSRSTSPSLDEPSEPLGENLGGTPAQPHSDGLRPGFDEAGQAALGQGRHESELATSGHDGIAQGGSARIQRLSIGRQAVDRIDERQGIARSNQPRLRPEGPPGRPSTAGRATGSRTTRLPPPNIDPVAIRCGDRIDRRVGGGSRLPSLERIAVQPGQPPSQLIDGGVQQEAIDPVVVADWRTGRHARRHRQGRFAAASARPVQASRRTAVRFDARRAADIGLER